MWERPLSLRQLPARDAVLSGAIMCENRPLLLRQLPTGEGHMCCLAFVGSLKVSDRYRCGTYRKHVKVTCGVALFPSNGM